MPRRIVSVDDSFNLPESVNVGDANLPERLQDSELEATIATQAVTRKDVTPNLVFDGDSITFGTGSDLYEFSYRRNYPNQAIAGLDKQTTLTNVAVGGQTMQLMIDDAVGQIDPLYQAGRQNICFVWGGTNDLYVSSGTVAVSAIYANILNYHMGRRAAGFQTVAFTILPRSSASTPANFETKRQELNTLIRANWATFADSLCDVGNDAAIGQVGQSDDLRYYADKTHPTSRGYGVIAGYARQALNTLGVVAAHDHVDSQKLVTSMWVPASAFIPTAGTPTLDVTRGAPTMLFDSAINESASASVKFPRGWQEFSAEVVWANTATSTGDVYWNVWSLPLADGLPYTTLTSKFKIVAAGANAIVKTSDVYDSPWPEVDQTAIVYAIRVSRSATNVSDTLANDAALLGVNFIRRN